MVAGAVEVGIGEGVFLAAGDGEDGKAVEVGCDAGKVPVAHVYGGNDETAGALLKCVC